MEGKIIAIVHILSLLICIIGTGLFLFPIFSMLNNMEPKRRRMITFFPFVGFLKNSYTLEGQKYYDKSMKGAVIAVIGLLGLMITLNL
jgi:hypothetical protein